MLNVLFDGFSVFIEYFLPISLFFLVVLGYGFLIKDCLAVRESDGYHVLMFSMGGGVIVLIALTFILFSIGTYWKFVVLPGSLSLLLPALFSWVKWIYSGELKKVLTLRTVEFALAFFLLLFIRLAFLEYVLLPPYSDSPIHYHIIAELLEPEKSSGYVLSLTNILSNYYHFGFHVVTAWLSVISRIAVGDAISLLGQIFLVIAPISISVFIYFVTHDRSAALYAALTTAIGWSMPAFAVNWGKFPAISSLAVVPAVLAMMAFIKYSNIGPVSKIFWIVFLLGGIALLHTRILICLALGSAIFFLVNKISLDDNGVNFLSSIRFSLLYLVSLAPLADQMSSFYDEIVPLVAFLIVLPFAFQVYPKLFIGVFLYTFVLWFTTWSSGVILGEARSLLDRQFVEMALYIPFSVMTGTGFAALMTKLTYRPILQRMIYASFVGGILMQFIYGHSVYPDECCNYFKEDDQKAFAWITEKTPENSLFLISSFEEQGKRVGTDAGIWIYLLTKRPTNSIPFDVNWGSFEDIEELCSSGTKNIYIYDGGREFSFQREPISNSNVVFQSGKLTLYQVITCSG